MIDLTLKKEQSVEVVCHTPITLYPGMDGEYTFQVGKVYEMSVEKYIEGPNRLWVKWDSYNGCRFCIDKAGMILSLVPYTDYFIDMETYRESEINKVLEL
tara:strand:+ start:38288 stop:38587 length:300 start_codon:yes stop_codon:yes gene_type:complete